MQILITHGTMARTRVLRFSRTRLVGVVFALAALIMLMSGTIYHAIFMKAAREGWPVVSHIVRFVIRDEIAQRERYMRENLDAMARRLGEMQAKIVQLEAMGERVSGMAGVKPEDLKPLARAGTGGQGGPLVLLERPNLEQLGAALAALDEATDQHTDVFTLIESRLFESRLVALAVPNSRPVAAPVSSGFGFRSDPFTGRTALHTGLDFPADVGTMVEAAAGGVVRSADMHAAYGRLVEIDHGNGLVTRYAHNSKMLVKAGDLVKRGQPVAEVGSTGRSTGPHLHFEVLVDGVPQDPSRFLARGADGRRAARAASQKAPAG